jgi:uncharacterized membrane protein HdeD (DUF308 family)
LLFGWVVLSARSEITTVWAVAVYAGILFLMFGVGELATAMLVPHLRWLHIVLGIIGLIAGINAFVWPEQTFFTLAAIIGWFLLFEGTFQIAAALARRHESDLWWLLLIVGVIEVLIAFWAIGYPGRSVALLIIWVGASALAKGLAQIIGAFALRSIGRLASPE